ncbi:unnamed protein product [Allacma fusca]|uniref:Neurotransmitter-gated ion-channel ligand-binding domain-containing protein n=1 Tax=Allacma fusca TaxID=39272 RepID=A0A8J2PE71_9HEXA|nr:unnamed protein product [Allacma fusca]
MTAHSRRFQRILCLMLLCFRLESGSAGNPDAKRLYDDLLSNYNKLVRPVVNVTDALTVKIKLKLSQLIDVTSPICTIGNGDKSTVDNPRIQKGEGTKGKDKLRKFQALIFHKLLEGLLPQKQGIQASWTGIHEHPDYFESD